MPKVISEGYCKTVFFERSAFALEVGNTSRIRKVSDRNRSKFEIIAEVLKELRTPSGKTNIMSQCNMSFAQSGHYLDLMTSNDLVRKDLLEGRTTYHRTEAGREFLEIFNKMALLLDPSISTPWWRLAITENPA